MWTPKRVVLLVSGFVVLLTAYGAYAHFLGGIDGLPALPEEYWQVAGGEPTEPPPQPSNSADDKLRQAFGQECPELNDPIRLEVRSKGMVLAAEHFDILHGKDEHGVDRDGQAYLTKVSLALFSKDTGDGKFPEINTVRSKEAYLRFDQPITNPAELGKHKIIGGELRGDVTIVNNRRTPQRDDDLTVFTPGRVFYNEEDHHVWTNEDEPIRLTDEQTKPNPQKVTGYGMDLYLAVEQPQPASQPPTSGGKSAHGRQHKPKQDAITGVQSITLRHDVEMHLYVDSNSGFLGGPDDQAAKPGDKEKAALPLAKAPDASSGETKLKEKAHVVINTQGPFVYDVPKAHAQFNISQNQGPYPNRVAVSREHEQGKWDQLDCEHLEIQFHPKEGNGSQPVREDRSVDLEIEWVHATGKDVVLASDVDMLRADCNDFFYDARTRQSTLKGDPEMFAVQQGNEIHAVELRIVQQQGAQQATAIGPGRISLLEKTNGKRSQHARWKDKLVSSRDGNYDLLVLTEEAAFIDDEHQQQLAGDTLKVWLEPAKPPAGDAPAADQKSPRAPPDGPAGSHGRRPHHVIAEGHVVARSPDMNVHDTDRLTIYFRDDPQAAAELAAAQARDGDHPAGAAAPGCPVASASPADRLPDAPGTNPAPPAHSGPPGAPAPAQPAAEPAKQARPMDLSARLVEAHVVRGDNKNELERLWTEGAVKVHQEPANPGDKGVDIKGETLQLTRKPEGNYLIVTGGGEGDDLANLLMDKILIIGPVVHVDQGANKAWVNGTGAMRVDSDTDFQGRKLKEPVPLTIRWDNSMFFDGQFAEFHGGPKGGVQAEQQNSRLLCRSMQAFFDRTISLKQTDKGAPPAKVRRLNCDQAVRVDDTEFDEKGKLAKYQRIECPELDVDNEAGEVHAAGPGVVRILQRGSEEPTGPGVSGPGGKPTTDPHKAPDDELKLTRVRYSGRMYANNKKHTATFTDEVRVIHAPSQDVDLEPNLDKLPEGGLYLEADRLTVWTRQDAEGKSSQMMDSDGHCYFQSQDSSGRSERITYDESKDQVILIGGENSLAYVYREKIRGGPRDDLKAKKIMYQRRTGQFYAIDATSVESH